MYNLQQIQEPARQHIANLTSQADRNHLLHQLRPGGRRHFAAALRALADRLESRAVPAHDLRHARASLATLAGDPVGPGGWSLRRAVQKSFAQSCF